MKKLRCLLSLLLVVVLITISAVSAFAVEKYNFTYDEFLKLDLLCWECVNDYGVCSTVNKTYTTMPGQRNFRIEDSSYKAIRKALDEAVVYVDGTVPYEDITSQDLQEKYDNLYNEMQKVVIHKYVLLQLINYCEEIKDENGYYDILLWSDFQSELLNAKEVYEDKAIVDFRCTEAFFNLLYSYNKLCTSNTVAGDVNNDGVVSIHDATLMQKILCGMKTATGSQTLVGGIYPDFFDINSVTSIQKYLAKIITEQLKCRYLDEMISTIEESNINSDLWQYTSWQNNVFYNEYYYWINQC